MQAAKLPLEIEVTAGANQRGECGDAKFMSATMKNRRRRRPLSRNPWPVVLHNVKPEKLRDRPRLNQAILKQPCGGHRSGNPMHIAGITECLMLPQPNHRRPRAGRNGLPNRKQLTAEIICDLPGRWRGNIHGTREMIELSDLSGKGIRWQLSRKSIRWQPLCVGRALCSAQALQVIVCLESWLQFRKVERSPGEAWRAGAVGEELLNGAPCGGAIHEKRSRKPPGVAARVNHHGLFRWSG
jgi:hypothetical protein